MSCDYAYKQGFNHCLELVYKRVDALLDQSIKDQALPSCNNVGYWREVGKQDICLLLLSTQFDIPPGRTLKNE